MYRCSEKLITCKEHCCFDHSDFPAHSVFTSDVSSGSLGTSIFGNSRSAAINTQSRLPSRLYFLFLWLKKEKKETKKVNEKSKQSENLKMKAHGGKFNANSNNELMVSYSCWTVVHKSSECSQ